MTLALTLENAEQLLDEKLLELFSSNTPLMAASRHALHGGKRLRPLLLLSAALTYDCPIERALLPALAWELVHTYSLIHDDLPCMDDDDERRGRPTLHRAFPEWHAVLTGDFLLTHAFELLASAPGLPDTLKLTLISLLSRSSGGEGMVGGQMLDLALNPKETSWPELEMLHRKKTGALFASALEAGGRLGNAPSADCKLLFQLGENFGLCYQIADDLADGESESPSALTTLGKERAEKLLQSLKAKSDALLQDLSVPAPLIRATTG